MPYRVCLAIAAIAALAACSSKPAPPKSAAASPPPLVNAGSSEASASSKSPVAKYIELSGIRIIEKSPGKLDVQFAVTNHSDAEIGDLAMTVNLRTSTAKATDPPFITFNTHINGLGPEELKQASETVPTKMRVYELPDWQFIRADFDVTQPK